jgi:sugar phosphate isomerase/epimerase
MSRWCKLSILTDEVSQELDQVINFAREFRLDGIELRSLWGKAFRDLSHEQVGEVRRQCDAAGLAISGCATPVFKCDLDDNAAIAEHVELFKRSIEAAHIAGCEVVRVFAFLRRSHPATSSDLERAASHFPQLIELARLANVIVGIENEASCVVATGSETREFLQHLPPSPHLGVVWDPCNVLYVPGDRPAFPDEFNEIADRVIHVHVKDAKRDGTNAAPECLELGKGEIDFAAHMRTLRDRGFNGWVTLETHWREKKLDAETQHLPAGYGFSEGAEPASRICMAHLQRYIGE